MAVLPSPTTVGTDGWTAPTGVAALLGVAQGQAAGLAPFPSGFIPPNFYPNYVPAHRGPTMVLVCSISMALAFLVAVARLVTRKVAAGKLGLDDWMIVPATLFCMGLTTENILAATGGGLGKHAWDMTYSEAVVGVQVFITHLLLYSMCIFFVKLSVLFFVSRLASPTGLIRWVVNFLFAFHIAFIVGFVFAATFQCAPVGAGFDLSLRFHPATKCRDYTAFYWITTSIHTASDIASLALPICLVVGLQMTWQKKAVVIFMFNLGGLACLCSTVRMGYIGKFANSYEPSWDAFDPSLWGQLEATISITTVSLPALKVLFARVIPGLLTEATSGASDSAGRSRKRDSLYDLFRRGSQLQQQAQVSRTTSITTHTLVEEEEEEGGGQKGDGEDDEVRTLPLPPKKRISTGGGGATNRGGFGSDVALVGVITEKFTEAIDLSPMPPRRVVSTSSHRVSFGDN